MGIGFRHQLPTDECGITQRSPENRNNLKKDRMVTYIPGRPATLYVRILNVPDVAAKTMMPRWTKEKAARDESDAVNRILKLWREGPE